MAWSLFDFPSFSTFAPRRTARPTRRSNPSPEARLLSDVLSCGQSREFSPPLNIYGGEDELAIRVEIPGVPTDAIHVTAEENLVVIEADRPEAELPDDAQYRRRERPVESIRRTVEVPFRVDAEKISASYERGILEVRVPRAEEDKPRRIEVSRK